LPTDVEHRRLALGCLLAGFTGPTVPAWVRQGLADGLGGVVLFGSNIGDGEGVERLTTELRDVAGRNVVIALDEEGGDVTRLDAVRGSSSPGAAALGALDDVRATEAVYAAIGARLADAGITVNLAPDADVNIDADNPVIGVRSFGADPQLVARHSAAAVRGLQSAGIAACAKHFPGHGATKADSHHGAAVLDRTRDELDAVELVPFRAAIDAGVRAVMTSHLYVSALDADAIATVSAPITTGVLRDELDFDGTIVTDALEMRALADTVGMVEGFVGALIAGADAVETGAMPYPHHLKEIPNAVVDAVHAGRLSTARLEDAARRTRDLARPPGHHIAPDPTIGAVAAERAIELSGALPRLNRALIVECRTPNGMATGELPWSLAAPLARLIPDAQTVEVTGPADVAAVLGAAGSRPIVLVVRDPARFRWQAEWLRSVSGREGAVVVDVGWPVDLHLDPATTVVRTRGIAPVLLQATARLLTRHTAVAG
jgi:beta-N-acetylhexosaminidase